MNKKFVVLTIVFLTLSILTAGFLAIQRANAAETYNLVVNFLFPDNTIVYEPFTAIIDEGANYSTNLTFPSIQGYLPYIEDDATSSSTMNINLTNVRENHIITVWYKPAQVSYRVDHYQQNIDNDDYTLYESETLIGYTKDRPEGLGHEYPGFYALVYDPPEIAADGSTVIRLYYDRYYYLINFVANGGVGAEPIFDRYGATITAPTPTRPGYNFTGWSPSVPSTIPVNGGAYEAQWSPASTTYTVLYLYENVDDNGYTTVATAQFNATSEQTITSASHQNDSFSGRDDDHFTYNSSLGSSITVAGDGTSFIPVYFSRNILTFHFTPLSGSAFDYQGKYQSSFALNGYTWPSTTGIWAVVDRNGNSSNSLMTFLAAFLPTDTMETNKNGTTYYFKEQTYTQNNYYVHFYTQNLDGTYNVDMTPYDTYADATVRLGSNSFGITDKFPGFHVLDYRTWQNNQTTEYYFTYNGDEYFGVRYQVTTATTGTQYGIVSGELVQLQEIPDYAWTTQYNYTSTTSTGSGTYYGIINNEYVQLQRIRYQYTEYTGTPAEGNNSYYGWYNNEFTSLWYHNGEWWRTRQNTGSWLNPSYTYSNKYEGTVYARGNNTSYYFYYGGTQYTGTRYTRSNTGVSYTGTRYLRSGSSAPYTYTPTTDTTVPAGGMYGILNGGYVQLNRQTGATSSYQYQGQTYTGTRYATTTSTAAGTYYGVVNGQFVQLTRDSRTSNWSAWTSISVGQSITPGSRAQIRFQRVENQLSFYNYDSYDTVHQVVLPYQTSLATYNYVPDYPSGLPYGKYSFAGWYDNSECLGTPFDFINSTMPMNALTLFAKWEPNTFRVEVYENIRNAQNGTNMLEYHDVVYNNLCPAPTIPTSDYTFIGWFYEDEEKNEHPFPFSIVPVTQNIKVYGKWTSNQLVGYTVHFQLEDGTPVADDLTGYALAGSSKTFWASYNLYTGYEHGYFPASASHSMVFELNQTNEYTFVYYHLGAAPYTVHYVDSRTGATLLPDKVVSDNQDVSVTERFVPIANYIPDHFQKSILISALEPQLNAITFYYTEDTIHAYYLVSHYIESTPGVYTLYNALDVFETIGANVSASPLTIAGYTYNSSATGTVTSGTVTAAGLELKLYYDANSYPYVVRYVNANTSAVLAPQYNGTAKYRSTVTANAIAISGYRVSGDATKSITIEIDTVGDVIRNIITFYYYVDDATINYIAVPANGGTLTRSSEHLNPETGLAQSTTATAAQGYDFIGWFEDTQGTVPVNAAHATVNGNVITPLKYNDGSGQIIYHDATYYAVFRQRVGNLTIRKTVNGLETAYTGTFTMHLTLSNMTNQTINTTGDVASLTFVNGTATFNLGEDDYIVVADIPEGTTYTLTEDDYSSYNFRTTIDNPTGSMTISGVTVNVINTFIASVGPTSDNTGRIATASAIILGVSLACAAAFIFLKKFINRKAV